MNNKIIIEIEKISNGYVVKINHDVFGTNKPVFFDKTEFILDRIKDALEGM